MKNVIKTKNPFSGQIITFTVSEELDNLDASAMASEKVAVANEMLRKIPAEKLDKLFDNMDKEETSSLSK